MKGANAPVDDTAGSWLVFGDAQTAKLNDANGHTADSIHIVRTCEAKAKAQADKLMPKPFWRRLFGR